MFGRYCALCRTTSVLKTTSQTQSLSSRYEAEGRYRKQVRARKLWEHIVSSQIETGTPYIVYKVSRPTLTCCCASYRSNR